MNVDDLKHFLEIEQGHSHVSRELCLEIMNECEPSTQLRKKEMLGADFIRSNALTHTLLLNLDAQNILIRQTTILSST